MLPPEGASGSNPQSEDTGELTFFKRPTFYANKQEESDSDSSSDDESSSESSPPAQKPAAEPVDFHIKTITDASKKKQKEKQYDEDGDPIRKIHYKQRKLYRPKFSLDDDDQVI